jgi:hypothetical protein
VLFHFSFRTEGARVFFFFVFCVYLFFASSRLRGEIISPVLHRRCPRLLFECIHLLILCGFAPLRLRGEIFSLNPISLRYIGAGCGEIFSLAFFTEGARVFSFYSLFPFSSAPLRLRG